MKTKTHLLLAKLLCDKYLVKTPALGKRLFILGSVSPDYNPFTYLKGFNHKPFFGHNREHTKGYIERKFQKLKEGRIGYFELGRLIHYTADAFTLPHNGIYNGTLKEHTKYEISLHNDFILNSKNQNTKPTFAGIDELHSVYSNLPQGVSTDLEFILKASYIIMNNFCHLKSQANRAMQSASKRGSALQ